MELLAYHKWLLQKSAKDRRHLAVLLFMDIAEQNPMAFDLLKMTDHKEYDEETFLAAADILIIQSNKDEKTKQEPTEENK